MYITALGGTMCKPQSTTAPEVGSRRPKGHEQSALRIVAPGRARVARRRPVGRRRYRPGHGPRPSPAPSRPCPGQARPPGPLPSVPLPGQRIRHHWPRSAWRPINSLRESKGTGGAILIDQDQEQPEYSDLPPVGELLRVRRFVTPASLAQSLSKSA